MRRVSKKRQKRLSEVKVFRENLRFEIKWCERCGRLGVVLHEISRGPDRARSLDQRCAILGVCDPGCHQVVERWPRAKQLALLYMRRPYDFDLPRYHAIIGRITPDQEEVLEWVEPLMEELSQCAWKRRKLSN